MIAAVRPLGLSNYYRHPRREVIELVPLAARTVLDVGCAAGLLGEQLRARQGCEVWGIETDPEAARLASGRLARVLEAPAERAAAELPARYFDGLILADVLEHLTEPLATLRALAPSLAPGASVIISVPNIQYHVVLRDLLAGRWTYRPSGILDSTHLRFFTRASIVELVRLAGLSVERIAPVFARKSERRAAWWGVRPSGLPVAAGTAVEDFYATQFHVVARCAEPPPDTSGVKVSIVMLTYNRFDVTKPAIESVRAATRQPYELIIVDNGSQDGTLSYLDEIEREGATVIRNGANRGVAAGWNQGLRAATGECLMVLNNDVLVAGDWLERMVRAAYSIPGAGLVGTRTSLGGGPQRLVPDYEDVADFPLFARRYSQLADGSWFEVARVVAVAMLWRREVYERLGEFDERFAPANFEDDDYSLRALKAGYRNVIANDVFVHHVGSASHSRDRTERNPMVHRNAERLRAKWGAAAAPVVAMQVARFDPWVAQLRPEQYALPGWALPVVGKRALAHYFARVGRRLLRWGWRRPARAAFRRSLATGVTLGGIAGWLWSWFAFRRAPEPEAAAGSRSDVEPLPTTSRATVSSPEAAAGCRSDVERPAQQDAAVGVDDVHDDRVEAGPGGG